jgi:ADP-ribose pyrophosphatase
MHRTRIFDGRIFGVVRCRLRFENGVAATNELVTHAGAAVFAPIPGPGRILLVRQYRHAAGDFLWEIPAGRLEPGEDPLVAARRELAEECGLEARLWRQAPAFYPAPGYTNEVMHLFFAYGLTPARGDARPDHDEEIETRVFTRQELDTMIRRGKIRDGKTLAAAAYWTRGYGTARGTRSGGIRGTS